MLREEIFGDDLPTKTARQIELVLLRVLASLYAASHAMEMQKLMALGDAARATGSGVSMDPIWAAFDRGAEMARLVAEQIVPPANIGSKSGSGGGLTAVQPSIFSPATPPAPPVDSDNPMAFFSPARKTADGGQE